MTDIKHKMTSAAAESGNPALVDGPEWNVPHVIDGGSDGQVVVRATALDPPAGGGWTWEWMLAGGDRMVFDQDAAPLGWTRDTAAALNDRTIRLVTGARAHGGSWTVSGFTLATANLPSHTHDLANHTHGLSNHTHVEIGSAGGNVKVEAAGGFGGPWIADGAGFSNGADRATAGPTPNVSNGPSTNTSGSTGSGTAFGNDGTWRPLHRDMLVAVKD